MSSKHKGSPKLYKGMKSLNPNGRPKGSMNKFTALSRELMSIKGPEIVQKVVDMALEGDRTCLKMCMDRIIPTTKAVEFRSSEDRGNVIINVGGLTEKIIEEDKKKSLDYEEGIIISEKDEDEALVRLGTNG
jgi:predicted ThiF/HesA family dinucleotide-utilizing enzyme